MSGAFASGRVVRQLERFLQGVAERRGGHVREGDCEEMTITVNVNFPAMDRLLDWIERHDTAQAAIDGMTERLKKINAAETAALKTAAE